MAPLAAIDFEGLGKVVASTLILTSVFTVVSCTLIVCAARSAEMRRAGHAGAALVYSVGAVAAGAALAALVLLGLIVMTTK